MLNVSSKADENKWHVKADIVKAHGPIVRKATGCRHWLRKWGLDHVSFDVGLHVRRAHGSSFVFVLFFSSILARRTTRSESTTTQHVFTGESLLDDRGQSETEFSTLLKSVFWIFRVKNFVIRANCTCRLTFHDGSWFSYMRAAAIGFPREVILWRYKRENFPDKLQSRTRVYCWKTPP